jgi:hypothetical protein
MFMVFFHKVQQGMIVRCKQNELLTTEETLKTETANNTKCLGGHELSRKSPSKVDRMVSKSQSSGRKRGVVLATKGKGHGKHKGGRLISPVVADTADYGNNSVL